MVAASTAVVLHVDVYLSVSPTSLAMSDVQSPARGKRGHGFRNEDDGKVQSSYQSGLHVPQPRATSNVPLSALALMMIVILIR